MTEGNKFLTVFIGGKKNKRKQNERKVNLKERKRNWKIWFRNKTRDMITVQKEKEYIYEKQIKLW